MAAARTRRVEVPADLVRRPEFAGADYASAFAVGGGCTQEPERWARRTFEGAPAPFRALLLLGWRLGLRLRLRPCPDGEQVLGWRLATDATYEATLSAESDLLTATNVFLATDQGVVWVTLVHYRRGLGRVLWSVMSRLHELTVPWLLRRAARA